MQHSPVEREPERRRRERAPVATLTEGLRGCFWHGGVLEGAVAAAMVAGTGVLMSLPPDVPLTLLAFCGTLLVYHLDRTPALSPEDRLAHPARWRWRHRYARAAALLATGAALGACWALPHVEARTLGAGALLAVPAAGYALPLFGPGADGAARRLKDIGAVKPLAVAAAWATASVLVPALEAGARLPVAHLAALVAYRFGYLLPNLLLADAADSGFTRPGARRLHRWALGVLAALLAGGVATLYVGGAPALLALDLGGAALLLASALVLRPGRRLAHGADLVMLWPVLVAIAGSV